MIHAILGPDSPAKDAALAKLRAQWKGGAEAENYDYQVLDGRRLDPKLLKQALLHLPAVARQRLVILKNFDKLSDAGSGVLTEFVKDPPDHCLLVLESPTAKRSDAVLRKGGTNIKITKLDAAVKANVFDMTRLLDQGRLADALKTLNGMITDGTHPLQIMGGLVWFWGQRRQRVHREQFAAGLNVLEEADLNIKRSRLPPDRAVELAVIKLAGLMG